VKMLAGVFVVTALLAGSGAAVADPWHDHNRGHGQDDRHEYRGPRYYSDRSNYGGRPHWDRGYRYDGPMMIVDDYRAYRLAPPPYGYRWVRNGGSYLLVSIGDNVILDMVIR
jgi:Ni/Co efflux regulator RcnB